MPHDALSPAAKKLIEEGGALSRHKAAGRDDAGSQSFIAKAASFKSRATIIIDELESDIEERENMFASSIDRTEIDETETVLAEFNNRADIERFQNDKDAASTRFEQLRALNDGLYPKNRSRSLYLLGLLAVGIGEWYVNFSTFAEKFVPALAIVATIMTALVFACASHFHGIFLKQREELLSPKVNYQARRREINLTVFVTVALLLFFSLIIYLRFLVLSRELGVSNLIGPFNANSQSLVWKNLWPTIAFNIGIWFLGTVFSYMYHEKIPELREVYRHVSVLDRKLDGRRKTIQPKLLQISEHAKSQRTANASFIKDYRACASGLRRLIDDITGET